MNEFKCSYLYPGGGNNITGNALFNFCRDSGDHGPFNS